MAIPPPGYDMSHILDTAGYLPGDVLSKIITPSHISGARVTGIGTSSSGVPARPLIATRQSNLHSVGQIQDFIKQILNDLDRPPGTPVFVGEVVVGFINVPHLTRNARKGDTIRLLDVDEIVAPAWSAASQNWALSPMPTPTVRENTYFLDETMSHFEITEYQINDEYALAYKLHDFIKQFCIGHTAHFEMQRMMSTMTIRFSFRSLALRVSAEESEILFDRDDFAPVDHRPVMP